MQSDWDIEIEKPKFAAKRLASLQVESPSNSQTSEEIGILLSLWCGREAIHVDVEKSACCFNVGFSIGEIEITVKNGRISAQNRFKEEFFREKIDQNAKDTSIKNGNLGAALGFDLSRFLPGTKFGVEAGAKIAKDSVAFESKEGNYYRVYWRVADAGHNTWRCFGYGLNADNVLENRILGDDILCFIVPEVNEKNVEITVRYYCDLQDLWFQVQHAPTDLPIGSEKIHRNREAVASAVLARSLNRSSRQVEGAAGRRRVMLCQQRIIAKRSGEVEDD